MSKRLYYVDWLRVGAVLLLFPFHTWRVFNANDPFYVKSPYLSQTINAVIGFIDTWHMPLLFLLAGASTYFALRKRTGLQYVGERFLRLGVPFLFGWLVLIPPQTWYGAQFNHGLGYGESLLHYMTSGTFLVWNIQGGGDYFGGFGMGQLWFIFYLFFISLFALPLLLWWRSERGQKHAARFSRVIAHPAGWLLAAFIILIGEALPSPIDDKRFFMEMALFILGYAAMADPKFMETAEKWRWPALIVGVAASAFSSVTGDLRDSLPDLSLPLLGLAIILFGGLWLVLVGLLGIGKHHFDKPSPTLSYLAEASYPLYILHQTVIVVIAFYLIRIVPGPWVVQWVALLAIVLAVTFGIYEVIRRVGVLRFLFGMRPKPKAEPATVPA